MSIGDYPAGTEYSSSAPWNKEDEQLGFNVTISQTLSKELILCTDAYKIEQDYDSDGMGYTYTDTSDVSWHREYNKEYYKIPELLKILLDYVNDDLANDARPSGKSYSELWKIKKSCEGWVEDECEITEE